MEYLTTYRAFAGEEMPDILAVAKLEITFFCKEEYRAENTQKKLKLRLKKERLMKFQHIGWRIKQHENSRIETD